LLPAGTEVTVAPQARVAPVTPVNSPAPAAPVQAATSPGVINNINPVIQAAASASAAATTAASKSDPSQGSSSDNSSRGFTMSQEQRQAAEPAQKTEEQKTVAQTKEEVAKVLSEHLASIWAASSRVVEIWMQNHPQTNTSAQQQSQTQAQATAPQIDRANTPGTVDRGVLNYSPEKVQEPGTLS
jgi:hypothetical protein